MEKRILATIGAVGAACSGMAVAILAAELGGDVLRTVGVLLGVAGTGVSLGVSYYTAALKGTSAPPEEPPE